MDSESAFFFFFFLILIYYLFIMFIFGCVGSSFLCEGFIFVLPVAPSDLHAANRENYLTHLVQSWVAVPPFKKVITHCLFFRGESCLMKVFEGGAGWRLDSSFPPAQLPSPGHIVSTVLPVPSLDMGHDHP